MTTQEKKAYIIKTIPISSGKRITEMLLRYKSDFFSSSKIGEKENAMENAKEVFGV